LRGKKTNTFSSFQSKHSNSRSLSSNWLCGPEQVGRQERKKKMQQWIGALTIDLMVSQKQDEVVLRESAHTLLYALSSSSSTVPSPNNLTPPWFDNKLTGTVLFYNSHQFFICSGSHGR